MVVFVGTFDIVIALIIQVVQFQIIPHIIAVIGAIIVIVAVSIKAFESDDFESEK